MIPDNLVDLAYKKLKQMIYYDKTLLFLRKRLAEFECEGDLDERLKRVQRVITEERPFDDEQFHSWLSEIDFFLVPKSVEQREKPSEEEGSYVSNVTSQKHYKIARVNYLFDGPIELHLLAVLWLMTTGHRLDRQLKPNCLGSRLDPLVGKEDDHSANLFLKYHELYSKWRDNGIGKAADLLTKENRSVCIIALDLQEFYYRVQLDWTQLWQATRVKNNIPRQMHRVYWRDILGENLLGCVKAICEFYQGRILPYLEETHSSWPKESTCLPIGLCSSPVIANWCLRDFDQAILSEVRPAYYGRYVDDIMIVVTSESAPKGDPVAQFMNDVLIRTGVMQLNKEFSRYEVTSSRGLFLQKKKCVLQFFEAGHSFAGLAKFRKELQENASDFSMLPVESDESPVDQVAYDLLYDGSANKLRSVKGIAENKWELAKHLAKQTQLQLLAAEGLDPDTKRELFRFFKGVNAINYWDMWERVFSFFIAAGNSTEATDFHATIAGELAKIRYEVQHTNSDHNFRAITLKLKESLQRHLDLSEEIARSLRESHQTSYQIWRSSNLIRHHLVAVPLLNYTDFNGDYIIPGEPETYVISRTKIERNPRFVHFDECVGLLDSWFVGDLNEDSITAANHLYARFHGTELKDVKSLLVREEGNNEQR
jgi:hypothetical protein